MELIKQRNVSAIKSVVGIVVVSILTACGGNSGDAANVFTTAPASSGKNLILDGVIVVNTENGSLSQPSTVVIENGLISSIDVMNSVEHSASIPRITATGKYLVPGYLDMHAHALNFADPESFLTMMLAHGITGFRQMSGLDSQLKQRQQAGSDLVFSTAPALLSISGPIINQFVARNPEEARAEVIRQAELGVDFIKIVDSTPETFMATLDEAARQGLTVSGHLPETIDEAEAAKYGMKSIEHLGPLGSVVMGCSSAEDELRHQLEMSPPEGPPNFPKWLIPVIQPLLDKIFDKVIANPTLINSEENFVTMRRLIDTYNEEKCHGYTEQLAQQVTWQVPTLIRMRTMAFGNAAEYQSNKDLRFIPSDKREFWQAVAEDFGTDISAENRQTLADFFDLQIKLTAALDRSNVKMLTGSDFGGGWIIPGISLHEEFDLLERAGISPLRVLQMATLNGAIFLGREQTMGTVDVGKEGNLVLLDANPIASVQNLHKINAVIRKGQYYDTGELDKLIEQSVRSQN